MHFSAVLGVIASLALASVSAAAPTVAYPPAVSGSAGLTLTVTPGVISDGPISATVTPALPVGLALNATTGVLTGTPVTAGTTTHQITIGDRTGQTTTTIRLDIAAGAPAVVYPSLVRGNVDGALRVTPGVRVVGAPRFSIAPELPSGLSLDSATGVISGTARSAVARSLFVVLMRDDAGPHVATFELEIVQRTVATIAGTPVTSGAEGAVPALPRFPSRASGNVLVATVRSPQSVRRAFAPRSARVARLQPGVTVRVVEALRVGRTLRVRVLLPGKARTSGWVSGGALRTRVVSLVRWDEISASATRR